MTLAEYMTSCASRWFTWGVWDCCLMLADVARVLTGRDPAQGIRYTYSTGPGAAVVLERLGGIEAVPEIAGFQPAEGAPRDGDAVLVDASGIYALGIWWQGVARQPGFKGLAPMPVDKIKRVWRAPEPCQQ